MWCAVGAATPYHGEQAESRHHLPEPLSASVPDTLTELDHRHFEHEMGQPYADHTAGDLRRDISESYSPGKAVDQTCRERHRRIHMRTRKGAEGQNQRHQRASSCDRVGEQRQRHVSAAQALGHDAGADHGD